MEHFTYEAADRLPQIKAASLTLFRAPLHGTYFETLQGTFQGTYFEILHGTFQGTYFEILQDTF